MDKTALKEVAFQASTIHPGNSFYVAVGLKGDVPVHEGGYLVMVNEQGDRVASCAPDGHWIVDNPMIPAFNKFIPTYKNAIYVGGPELENK
ncbi:MAG: hypothetical protein E6736_06875 [Leclercia adecarboxylata]|nr:hypothetical protein [Bacillus amyloliquefaciens]MDU2019958.1 hypothetical protein [Leclercia adecarboxylata]